MSHECKPGDDCCAQVTCNEAVRPEQRSADTPSCDFNSFVLVDVAGKLGLKPLADLGMEIVKLRQDNARLLERVRDRDREIQKLKARLYDCIS